MILETVIIDQPNLPDIPPPVFERNYHQAQTTVLSVGIGSELREVSIADC